MKRRFKNRFVVLSALTAAVLIGFSARGSDPSAPRSAVAVGQKAPAFHARTVDGKTVNFPDDYKGKVVLLDFWATWCPPCRKELPNVVAAYNQYHDKGFEVLSVSLDRPQQGPMLLEFIKNNNMTWPQIYDGHGSKGTVPMEYGIHAIPCPVLVNGDTGTIIATDRDALGQRLTRALDTAVMTKAKAK